MSIEPLLKKLNISAFWRYPMSNPGRRSQVLTEVQNLQQHAAQPRSLTEDLMDYGLQQTILENTTSLLLAQTRVLQQPQPDSLSGHLTASDKEIDDGWFGAKSSDNNAGANCDWSMAYSDLEMQSGGGPIRSEQAAEVHKLTSAANHLQSTNGYKQVQSKPSLLR